MEFERCSSNKIGGAWRDLVSLTFIHILDKTDGRTERGSQPGGRISDVVINVRTDDSIWGD